MVFDILDTDHSGEMDAGGELGYPAPVLDAPVILGISVSTLNCFKNSTIGVAQLIFLNNNDCGQQ